VIENAIHHALAESVREVLEKMCFIDLPAPAAGDEVRMRGIAAELVFDGDPPGSFRLDLDANAARVAAAGFLGEDPAELPLEQVQEVICELANMICGSVLSRVESSAVFRLTKPEMAAEAGPCPSNVEATIFEAGLGDGTMRAEIRMERPVCPGIDGRAS
jgi:CheY-specific phosphatase CheX